ncbi:hypothetical protein DFR49_0954 [Hephaestia caeni]|uniref:Uncharacterized protein n=1 Tax=Hephaestia caeni TaxID=645617 RepID=A0A397PDD5_9SPHN|nr:hypothetical protein [Hephaestia caeni]RIA46413.1 hypothetical protein DFR49_0954 [Hephaestia caeni]
MAENATIVHDRLERGRCLISRLPTIIVALSEAEYHVATILAFDPEASIPAGALVEPTPVFERRLSGSHLSYRGWMLLARACAPDLPREGDSSCLAAFLVDRVMASEPQPGAAP